VRVGLSGKANPIHLNPSESSWSAMNAIRDLNVKHLEEQVAIWEDRMRREPSREVEFRLNDLRRDLEFARSVAARLAN
jgi:hypothetical protein